MKRSAHAEYPHSRTSRMVGNIRACDLGGGQVEIRANFIVNRVRNGVLDAYIGQYEHLVERDESGQFKFVVRRSVLALDALRPHGKVSIIL
jgi:p-cumate 2,3-dioxygenase beta subunit